MDTLLYNAFNNLKNRVEQSDYAGWDPYDGLSSKVFNATPLKYSAFARLAWIQLFKRNPINLRRLMMVPKGHNSKALGLFLSGYCNLLKIAKNGDDSFGNPNSIENRIHYLSDLLIKNISPGYSGACWGYNFDWQSKAFFLPDNTPTVVATSFVVESLVSAYLTTQKEDYLKIALTSSEFILNDLNRIQKEDDLFMFSYSPLDDRAVYNATLLGSKTLAILYHFNRDEQLKDAAFKSIKAVCNRQYKSGAFPHSDQVGDKWKDNFHTGFKLESIAFYLKYCDDSTFDENLAKGVEYWIKNFFLDDGTSKYYDNSIYPIDLHCPSQAISTLYKTGYIHKHSELAKKIIEWPIEHMFSKKGYFYFQKSKYFTNKTDYMRWPNAWMFYGLSYWLLFLKGLNFEID